MNRCLTDWSGKNSKLSECSYFPEDFVVGGNRFDDSCNLSDKFISNAPFHLTALLRRAGNMR